MDDGLIQISQAGDVNGLYESIRNNAAVLKQIDEVMFEDTPLHIAASAGHTRFAVEVMNLMPPFARKLNKDGLSPIHLALLEGHSELVLSLLRDDRELVRVKGRGGMTPLHYAAQIGNIDLLAVFLIACPNSVEDVTVKSETVFHIAVRNEGIEALEVLVGWFKRVCHEDVSIWETSVLNWRDQQRNTALDIAVSKGQVEATKLLVEINAESSRNDQLVALGILQRETRLRSVVKQLMLRTLMGWTSSWPQSTTITLANYLRSKIEEDEKVAVFITRQRMKISEEQRNALLVVAGLIVAATIQAVFSPPGSVQQDSGNPAIIISNGTHTNISVTNTTAGSPSNDEGKSVMNAAQFMIFSFFNTFVLVNGVAVICLLLSESLVGTILILILTYFLICYAVSISVIAPEKYIILCILILLFMWVLLLYRLHMLYLQGNEKIQRLHYNANKCPGDPAADEDQMNNIDPGV